MICRRHAVAFQAIALVLLAAIACCANCGYAYIPAEEKADSAFNPHATQAKSDAPAGKLSTRDDANAANHPPPSGENPSGFLVVEIQLTGEDGVSLSWTDLGPNFVYTVEFCDSLAEGNWFPCEPTNQWPMDATSWTDTSLIGFGTRFYRIHTEALYDPPAAPSGVTAAS